MPASSYYGRHVTGSDPGLGTTSFYYTNGSNERATVFPAITQNGWGVKAGCWCGARNSGQFPAVSFAVWQVSSGHPATRLGHTDQVTVNTLMQDSTQGANYEMALVHNNLTLSPSNGAVKLVAGQQYAVGLLALTYQLNHGEWVAADITVSGANKTLYAQDVGAHPPTDPGPASGTTEGWLDAYVLYQANRAPTAVTALTPAAGAQVNTTTPTFLGTFNDQDQTDGYGDKLNSYHVQLRQQGTTTNLWDKWYTATNTEQTNKQFSRAYDGTTALVQGTTYEWRAEVTDQFGVSCGLPSTWTAFTVNSGGTITVAGTPTGKQNALSGYTFQGNWTHAGSLSMTQAQVLLYNGSGQLLQTGAVQTTSVASSASPGTAFSVTFAASGFANLQWGQTYQYKIAGKDSAGLWSYSPFRSFTTNAIPNTPTNLQPTGGAVTSSLPLLTFAGTDADDTPIALGGVLTGSVRVKNSSGTVLATVTPTWSTALGKWQFQTTATQLASFQTYKWDAQLNDTVNTSNFSSEATFVYAQGPVVTVTAPAANGTITTSTPVVTWTVTGQVKYRVLLCTDMQMTQTVWDTGTVTSATQNATVPAGLLHNGVTYYVQVFVTNSAPLTGSNTPRAFTLSYTQPAAPDPMSADPYQFANEQSPSAIIVTWASTTYAPSQFVGWVVARAPLGTDPTTVTPLALLTNPNQTTYLDTTPASGQTYNYAVWQLVTQGTDLTTGIASTDTAVVNLDAAYLSDALAGDTLRVVFRYDTQRQDDHQLDVNVLPIWGSAKPKVLKGLLNYADETLKITFVTDVAGIGKAGNYRAALEAMRDQSATLCFRDERGTKFFCTLAEAKRDDRRPAGFDYEIRVIENDYSEGILV